MAQQVAGALAAIHDVLQQLETRVCQLGAEQEARGVQTGWAVARSRAKQADALSRLLRRTRMLSRCSLSHARWWENASGASL